jgi:Predicted signal-transduction protein containing cAMP-binding and CBS domains
MKVRDLMTEKPKLARVTMVTMLPEVAKKMKEADTGIIPVVDEQNQDKLIGLITDRDIAVRAVAEGIDLAKAKVVDFMSKELNCISPDTDASEAGRLMSQKQVHRLCVVENDKLVGILSLGDLVEADRLAGGKALEGISHGAKSEKKMGQ